MLSVRFLSLVERFHQDCASDEVELLAANLVAEISLTLYLCQSREVKLLTVAKGELRRLEPVFRYLHAFGLDFVLYPLSTEDQFILAARLEPFTTLPNVQRLTPVKLEVIEEPLAVEKRAA